MATLSTAACSCATTTTAAPAAKAGKVWTADDHALMLRLSSEGESHAAIGSRLGRTAGAINSRLKLVADGAVPPTKEMKRLSTTSTLSATPILKSATAARVSRHAPPMAKPSAVASSPTSSSRPAAPSATNAVATPRAEVPVHRPSSSSTTPRTEVAARGAARAMVTPRSSSRLKASGSPFSSEGWKGWPRLERGQYGLVYIPHKQIFGYYDDDSQSASPKQPSEERHSQGSAVRLGRGAPEPADGISETDGISEASGESGGEFSAMIYRESPLRAVRGPCLTVASSDVVKPPFPGEWVAN